MAGEPIQEYFDSVREIYTPSALDDELVFNFDLTDALNPFLTENAIQVVAGELGSSKKRLKNGDVVISRLRSYLKEIAIVDVVTKDKILGSSEFIVLRPKANINSDLLLAFLHSNSVQTILKWSQDGSNHPRFQEDALLNIKLPSVITQKQKYITDLTQKAIKKHRESFQLYTDAENLLASELGLDKLDLSERLSTVKNVSDIQRANRIDAEYFQPKYERILRLMGKSGKTVSDIADLGKRRFEPVAGKSFQYIEISDLASDGLAESQTIQGEEAPSRAQWVVGKGDVITSTVRPIRRLSAIIAAEQDGFVCSSGFAVLKPKSIPSELLLTYLRIPVVCEILDLFTTASMYPAISTADLLSIPVTLPTDKKIVNEIINKIQHSRQARQEAKRLLAEAKAEVERLIEGK